MQRNCWGVCFQFVMMRSAGVCFPKHSALNFSQMSSVLSSVEQLGWARQKGVGSLLKIQQKNFPGLIYVEMLPLPCVCSSAFQGEKQLYFSKIAGNRSSQSAIWYECKFLGTEIEHHTHRSWRIFADLLERLFQASLSLGFFEK